MGENNRGKSLIVRPNGLGISGGALLDREDGRADTSVQKSTDLVGAERRPLHARVGRGLESGLLFSAL